MERGSVGGKRRGSGPWRQKPLCRSHFLLLSHPSLQAALSSHVVERRTTRGWIKTRGRRSKKIQSRENTSRLMFFDLNNYLVSLYKHQCYIIDSRGSRGSLWMETCLTCCLGLCKCLSAVCALVSLFNVSTSGPVAIKLTAARTMQCVLISVN